MAFDPHIEDFQRLGLRYAHELQTQNVTEAAQAFATFGSRFVSDYDSLPQSDEDRAFHLVAKATTHIDYELPFAQEEEANELIDTGHRVLEEALSIDPHCYDAVRMKAAAANPSFEKFYTFLSERCDEVRAFCEKRRDEVDTTDLEDRVRLAQDIAMRPYLRWIATQAEQALICGRNKECLRVVWQALETDPQDSADVRFTAALAYAKLEDEAGLDQLIEKTQEARASRPTQDAWTLLAKLALAHKRYDLKQARFWLREIMRNYPFSAQALIRQHEFPDGVFSRLAVAPYSEDEVILAISEASVLLQEGVEPNNRGVLGTWVARETAELDPDAAMDLFKEGYLPGPQMGGTL